MTEITNKNISNFLPVLIYKANTFKGSRLLNLGASNFMVLNENPKYFAQLSFYIWLQQFSNKKVTKQKGGQNLTVQMINFELYFEWFNKKIEKKLNWEINVQSIYIEDL